MSHEYGCHSYTEEEVCHSYTEEAAAHAEEAVNVVRPFVTASPGCGGCLGCLR